MHQPTNQPTNQPTKRGIQSKKDYLDYIEADRIANHAPSYCKSLLLCRLGGYYNYLYLRYMRKTEYIFNCKNGIIWKIIRHIIQHKLRYWSAMTGITIPPNTFGKGLYIPHWGSIVVNGSSFFGDYCVVQSGVNVSEGVIGGNHIYLGAGSKLIIGARIGNDVIVGANAVVTKSFEEDNVVIAGAPAKIISTNGFRYRVKV